MLDSKVTQSTEKPAWYSAGLHFQCLQCGACCSGPDSGYVWVTAAEIEHMAEFLEITPDQLRQRYLRRVGTRTSLVEKPDTLDCIFLDNDPSRPCRIYQARPSQCKTWPFWPENLSSPTAWNRAAEKCPGINRGRLYSRSQIDALR